MWPWGEPCDIGSVYGGVATVSCDGPGPEDCTLPVCGDWYVNPAAGGSANQGGVATSTCTASCTMPLCGNGIVEGTEQCDDWGATTYFCEHDCTTPVCGDGYVNEAAGESCDPGREDCDSCGQSTYVYVSAIRRRATILIRRRSTGVRSAPTSVSA